MAALHVSGWHHTEGHAQHASTSAAAERPATKPAVPYASPFANNEMLTSSSGSRSPLSASGGSGAAGLAATGSSGQGNIVGNAAQQQPGEQQAMQPVVDFGCVHDTDAQSEHTSAGFAWSCVHA